MTQKIATSTLMAVAVPFAALFIGLAGTAAPARAQTIGQDGISTETTGSLGAGLQTPRTGASGLPLPRFASLKSANVNLRVGPGKEHPILWNYVKAGLPVEIVLEFDTWRKIRDADGVEGWVYQSMLSGRRTATVDASLAARPDGITAIIETSSAEPAHTAAIHAKPDGASRAIALLEAGVNLDVLTCDGTWCSVKLDARNGGLGGWIEQTRLWGVYPTELIDD